MKLHSIFKRTLAAVLALGTSAVLLTGCSGKKDRVVIYTSMEDYRVEYLRGRLAEEFPKEDIIVEYMPTGNLAAKLLDDGTETECDIIYDLEYTYMDKLEQNKYLLNLSDYPAEDYAEDLLISDYYFPKTRNGGAVILNPEVLAEKGLKAPTSYQDLLKPEYKGLVSMPNPKSSGTGYMFLLSLANAWGEEEALSYFDALTPNILQYTSSGSGPVNALIQKEAAIGLGMTAQAVTAIKEGAELEIIFFEEGSPYSLYGQGLIAKEKIFPLTEDVFRFISGAVTKEDNTRYYPEKIFSNGPAEVEGYPTNIHYADMSHNSVEQQEHLLSLWKY